IYLGSFSKSVAPGLRVAWIAAHRSVVPRLALAKQFSDLQSGGLGQAAMARFMTSGRLDAHISRTIPVYGRRRDAIVRELGEILPDMPPMTVPTGGFHAWLRLPVPATAGQVMVAAARSGVAVVPGVTFYPPHVLGRE